MMDKELKEYSEAVEENIKATQNESLAKEAKRKAHYRLIKASEALRLKERELLSDHNHLL